MIEINNLSANKFETLQKARRDLIGEIEAVIGYDEHAQNATDALSRQTWLNIKQEELVHVGELMALINSIDPSQMAFVEEGVKEFEERKNNLTKQSSTNQMAHIRNHTNQHSNQSQTNTRETNSTINKSHTKNCCGGFSLFSKSN